MKEIEMTVIETVCTRARAWVADDFDLEDTESIESIWTNGHYHRVVSVDVTDRHVEAEQP